MHRPLLLHKFLWEIFLHWPLLFSGKRPSKKIESSYGVRGARPEAMTLNPQASGGAPGMSLA